MGKSKKESPIPTIEEITQKEKENMKKTVILTVAATVAVIALFVTTFAAGVKWANSQHVSVQQKAESIAKQQASVKVETSKQQQ